MARKDDDPQAEPESREKSADYDDAFFERRSQLRRRQEEKQRSDKPQKAAAAAAPKKTAYEQFMEDHWVGWLRPVLAMAAAAVAVVAYRSKMVNESFAGVLVAVGGLSMLIYSAAMPVMDMIERKTYRALFGALVLLWGVSAVAPAFWRSGERAPLGEVQVSEAQKTGKATLKKGGPYMVMPLGHLENRGAETMANYEFTVNDGKAEEKVEGVLHLIVGQVQAKRSTTRWENVKAQEHRLSDSITGKEVTVTVESLDRALEEGMTLRFYERNINPMIYWIAGVLVVLMMMVAEACIGDASNKTHLTMWAASTLIFSYWYYTEGRPGRLVMPAVEAVFVAAILGGIGGTALGFLARRLSGRDKLKAREKDKDKERDEEAAPA